VVELLRPLVGYARGAGVDVRWLVIDGTPEFFRLTKRIHNRLHGSPGDGLPLGEPERRHYEEVLADNAGALLRLVKAGDVVIIHDPQPAGLIHAVREAGAAVIWRCHVGLDTPNELARETWAFLRRYVAEAHVYVFSREAFAWDGLDRDRIVVIPPSIDVFIPKNQNLDSDTIRGVLKASAVLGDSSPEPISIRLHDGRETSVARRAKLVEDQPLPPEAPLVLQVSRWDALKDPIGVIRGFAEHVSPSTGAHLVYAGPAVEAVSDDPEGARVLVESIAERERLPDEARKRIHLAILPMDDADENALIVNALQRHAHVIVQKSLAEGFGLTVAEAMWKARPVVASRIGGMQDQIVHGESGLLLDDPRDLAALGAAVVELLTDRPRAQAIGAAARTRIQDRFLSVRSLLDYLAVIRRLVQPPW
jgi:trehalose synthase